MSLYKPFFRCDTLNRDTTILAPEDEEIGGIFSDSHEELVPTRDTRTNR